ncbi:hypothetical protein Trydic_g9397 [Trypoxylus dichotomus]
MADKNIDYNIRKPRRTKGTPFYVQRNYYALGVVAFGGLAWLVYEFWPETKKLKSSVVEGKFKYSREVQDHILLMQRTTTDPALINGLTASPMFKSNRNKSSSSTVKLEISKYFSKEKASDEDTGTNKISTDTEIDSPYKTIVSKSTPVLNNTLEDDDDFKSPKCFKLPLQQLKMHKSNKTTKSKKGKRSRPKVITGQKRLTNMIKDNFVYSDMNTEHLQMALALSKSEQSDTEVECDLEEASCSPSTQKRIFGYRQTLEQFGFKSNKKIIRKFELGKKSKKSKYQFVTPILNIRTEEDRQNLISNKISMILSSSSLPNYIYEQEKPAVKSSNLSQFINESASIFNINNIDYKDLSIDHFYCKELNIERKVSKCGHLLKDWSHIPGRECTPPRDINSSRSEIVKSRKSDINKRKADEIITKVVEASHLIEETVNSMEPHDVIEIRSVSPDLFTSDDENTSEIKKKIDGTLESSMEMINAIKNFSSSQASFSNFDCTDNPLEKTSEVYHETLCNNLNVDRPSLYNVSQSGGIRNIETLSESGKLNKSTDSLTNFNKEPVMISESEILENTSSDINLNTTDTLSKLNLKETMLKQDENTISEEKNKILDFNSTDFKDEIILLSESDSEIECLENKSLDTTVIGKRVNFTAYDSSGYTKFEEDSNQSQGVSMNNTDDVLGKLEITCNPEVAFENIIVPKNGHSDILERKDANNIQLTPDKLQSSNNKNQLDNTDDILGTLEITLITNVQSAATPKHKQFADHSALLLNNLDSIGKTEAKTIEKPSSEDSDYNISFQNLNGVEHFESFRYDELNLTNQNMLMEFNEDLIDLHGKTNCTNRVDEYVISNDQNYNNLDKDNPSRVIDNIIRSHLDRIDSKTKTKSRSDNEFPYKKSKIKWKYEVLSDSSDDLEIEDHLRQNQVRDISDLLEKSILNHESLHVDVNESKLSRSQKNFARRSLSFSPGTNMRSPRKHLRKYASFSTPMQDKKTIKQAGDVLEKYLSSSSISSETLDENGVICVSDEELNYSAIYSTPYKQQESQDLPGNEVNQNDEESYSYLEKYCDDQYYSTPKDNTANFERNTPKSPIIHRRILELSNKKSSPVLNAENYLGNTPNSLQNKDNTTTKTPEGFVVIKTKNITPMPDYESMPTPKIVEELEKIGVKQLKRHRGIQMLKHIYENTHPIWSNCDVGKDTSGSEIDDEERLVKKRKLTKSKSRRRLDIDNIVNVVPHGIREAEMGQEIEIVGDIPESEPLIFERKQSKRVPSCPLPMHIAWHNLVSSNQELRQNILLYEPLQLEILYALLKDQGHRYHIQDLLTFLDKKCITIRTNQNNKQRRTRF